jgi:2-oxoglutarate ferredoxin oxidoreductase subunit gamma
MKEPKLTKIKICGKGGQGISYAGRMLAAAAVLQGKAAAASSTTGPEVRGHSVCVDIVISEGWIDYPRAQRADILIAFSQDEYKAVSKDALDEDGAVFYDPEKVSPDKSLKQKHYPLPAHELCRKQLGTDRVANFAVLSAISKLTRLVSLDALTRAAKTSQDPEEVSTNLKSLEVGSKIAKKLRFP